MEAIKNDGLSRHFSPRWTATCNQCSANSDFHTRQMKIYRSLNKPTLAAWDPACLHRFQAGNVSRNNRRGS